MNNRIRIPLYIVLVILAGISGYYALTNFGKIMDRAADRNEGVDQIEPERKPVVEETPATPAPAAGTNTATPPLGTNAAAVTNALGILTNAGLAATNTNAVAATEPVTPPPAEVPTALSGEKAGGGGGGKGGGRIGVWLGVFVLSLVLLGLLIANDVSHFMSNRALTTLYNDEGKGQEKDPEYDEAEKVWANGNFLEAIGLLREYLKKNPREQHVAIRIAEIYEKDLGNYLAAALEYEEVLKHKLPPDRWGWAAIHLCNLYFKLNQEEKGYALLRRLAKEHPETAAAEKARKRLQQVDGTVGEQIATESNVRVAPGKAPPKAEEAPASNLPPGFRPKK
jgi:TolA-binding protein